MFFTYNFFKNPHYPKDKDAYSSIWHTKPTALSDLTPCFPPSAKHSSNIQGSPMCSVPYFGTCWSLGLKCTPWSSQTLHKIYYHHHLQSASRQTQNPSIKPSSVLAELIIKNNHWSDINENTKPWNMGKSFVFYYNFWDNHTSQALYMLLGNITMRKQNLCTF